MEEVGRNVLITNNYLYSALLKPNVKQSSLGHIKSSLRSTTHSAIKATNNVVVSKEALDKNIRIFLKNEVMIKKGQVLGRCRFGKCFYGEVGPIEVSVKVLKNQHGSFEREPNILSLCCHSNVSYLFGVCLDAGTGIKMLVLSLHGHNQLSYTLHSVLVSSKRSNNPVINWDWRSLLICIISRINYIHSKDILLNDIKEDNIILEERRAVLIDFGKACFERNGRTYEFSYQEKQEYKK